MKGESILRALVEGNFTTRVWKRLTGLFDKALSVATVRCMSRFIPIEKDKIIFLTFRGSYDCNPKWICEEIVRRDLPYKLVWAFRKEMLTGMEDYPSSLKLVQLGTLEFFRELCSARVIVDNGISTAAQFYKKKKGQYLIETWHGSLGIKKFSKDAVNDKKWVKRAVDEGKMTDVCISNSDFEENEVYRPTYWKKTPIWAHGHARNDILCEQDTDRVRRIKKKIAQIYGLSDGDRICFYAPTFRDDEDMRSYRLDHGMLLKTLEDRFGGRWVIFTRYHYRTYKSQIHMEMIKSEMVRVINVTNYPDIQELALCTDVAITDYSSWICEYMLTRRPGFLFATDLKSYQKKDRPFFFPLSDLPFPVAEDQTQLFKNILSFDNEAYVQKCDAFLKEKGSVDDGHAAQRTVDEITRVMGGNRI